MQILILGNSNSIGELGYLSGLRAQFPLANLTNLSVGHSPGTQFAYYGSMDFSAYNVVIFDTVANDELFVDELGGWEYLRDYLFEMFSTIASQTRLFVMGFFWRGLEAPLSDVHYLHADLAELVGATFIDVSEFVLKYGPSIVPKGTDLMRDRAHPDFAVVQQLGHHLGRLIADQPVTPRKNENFSSNFHGISAADLFPGEVRYRHTGLAPGRLAIMRKDDSIEFDAERNAIGFYIDMSLTRCFIRLQGSKGNHSKVMLFEEHNQRMGLRFIPMRTPFLARRLTCLGPEKNYEFTMHSEPISGEDAVPILSLLGVAFWSGSPHYDLPIEQRGDIVGQRARKRMKVTEDIVLQAPDLPVVSGWTEAGQRLDGTWSRTTGPASPSILAFELERGRYAVELHVLGAVSAQALFTLRASAAGKQLRIKTVLDRATGFYRSSMTLQIEKTGPVELRLVVPYSKGGIGLEIAGMRIKGDQPVIKQAVPETQ